MFEFVQDKNPEGQLGKTPLHYAAENGHYEVCQLILYNVEDLAPQDWNSLTPLDYADENCHSEVIELINSFKPKVIWNDTFSKKRKIAQWSENGRLLIV